MVTGGYGVGVGLAQNTLPFLYATSKRLPTYAALNREEFAATFVEVLRSPSPTRGIDKLLKQLSRLAIQRLCQLTELNHVEASFATLYLRYKALRFPKPFREFGLRDVRSFPH